MITKAAWQELYQVALLELRPDELRERISVAQEAILRRIAELRQNNPNSAEEFRALDDALRGPRVLENTECKTAPSPRSGLAQREVS